MASKVPDTAEKQRRRRLDDANGAGSAGLCSSQTAFAMVNPKLPHFANLRPTSCNIGPKFVSYGPVQMVEII
jgi:hypothetical protein